MRYVYTCECGNTLEKDIPLSKFRQSTPCNSCGGKMFIDVVKQQKNVRNITSKNWPMESDALGVHPEQAKEFSEFLKKSGVPTEVLPNGNPVLTSRKHRKEVCAATGMYDRNAGYGDQAPQHVKPKIRRCYAG
jgi:hypothetical protein